MLDRSSSSAVDRKRAQNRVAKRRQGARERTARWRARLRRGSMVLPIEIDSEMLDLLQRLEHLRDGQLADRKTVALAARRVLTRALALLLHRELRNFR